MVGMGFSHADLLAAIRGDPVEDDEARSDNHVEEATQPLDVEEATQPMNVGQNPVQVEEQKKREPDDDLGALARAPKERKKEDERKPSDRAIVVEGETDSDSADDDISGTLSDLGEVEEVTGAVLSAAMKWHSYLDCPENNARLTTCINVQDDSLQLVTPAFRAKCGGRTNTCWFTSHPPPVREMAHQLCQLCAPFFAEQMP